MRFWQEKQSLMWRHQYETVMVTPWGKNALRIRATKYPEFTENDWALEEPVETKAETTIEINGKENASITNGRLCIKVDAARDHDFLPRRGKDLKRVSQGL